MVGEPANEDKLSARCVAEGEKGEESDEGDGIVQDGDPGSKAEHVDCTSGDWNETLG